MVSNDKITRMEYCVRCLEKAMGVTMTPKDFLVMRYPARCRCCGEVHHLVVGVKFFKRLFAHINDN